MIDGVKLTPLRIVPVSGGDVYHALKSNEASFKGFGEAYISSIHSGAIKTWKRHSRMTLNLIVISGEIRFVIHDDRPGSANFGITETYELGPRTRFARLTVPPGLWMAFEGLGRDTSLLLNVADMMHDPEEADRRPLDEIHFSWSGR
jgi:dTDP-4-dehydrorhamnose 3,5-epimerase